MNKICLLLIASIFLWISTAQAQKNAQGKVLFAIMEELSANYGEGSLVLFNRLKTELQFVKYLGMKAKTCNDCPVLNDFVHGLSVPARVPTGIPAPGTKIADQIQPGVDYNFGARILAYYNFNIYGVDDSQPQQTKCEPFYGLSRWGCRLPCQGFCPRDPIYVPPGIADDYSSDDDYNYEDGYDVDYEYDPNSGEVDFNYDDYEPVDSGNDYEYDPD